VLGFTLGAATRGVVVGLVTPGFGVLPGAGLQLAHILGHRLVRRGGVA
jgi:hypothetical protein